MAYSKSYVTLGNIIVTHEDTDLQCTRRKFLIPNICNHFGCSI